MKKNHFARSCMALAILGVASGSAMAENSLSQGAFALTVPVDQQLSNTTRETAVDLFVIKGKYLATSDLAVLAGFGLNVNGGDAEGTDFGLMGGVRKYLKRADFAPFFGGFISYTNTEDSNITTIGMSAEFGAEYFLGKQFSVEGSAHAGYTSTDNDITGETTNTFGTQGASLGINYYF